MTSQNTVTPPAEAHHNASPQRVTNTHGIYQQRCGQPYDGEPCNAWRLSRPVAAGGGFRQCWKCGSTEPAVGKLPGRPAPDQPQETSR